MYRTDVSNRYIAKICRVGQCRNRYGRAHPSPAGHLLPGLCCSRRTLKEWEAGDRSVDYGLARRATLASVLAGHTTIADVCDAHPYLLRAAKFHGEATDTACPICRRSKLTHVTYVYGDELGPYAGRVKQGPELAEMASEYGEFRVYVVEVCQSCAWNHLASSYVLGTGEPPARRSRRARASD